MTRRRNDTLWNTVRCTAEAVLNAEGALPLHPAYGLTDRTRLTILRDAAALGVKHAAETHNVAQTTVYSWRKVLLAAVSAPLTKEK